MRRRGWSTALLLVVLGACADTPAQPEGLSPIAGQYIDLALDVMEANSINRYEIDWPPFREQARADAGNARTPADTHDAIRAALVRLGDGHSFFQEPGAGPAATSARPALRAAVDPRSELIAPGIGYLDVPAFVGGGPTGDSLAATYHEVIEAVDTMDVCGWVVDARGNTGGNMWPMLAGVGPVLGDGRAGFFVDPDSIVNEWTYGEGRSALDGVPFASADPWYAPAVEDKPVAVLTDAETASSGEAVVVAFRGRPATRSFGEGTFGVSTANAAYPLPDGAVIFLTIAWMADRDGTIYGESLPPDEVVEGTRTGERDSDAALDAALTWLETEHCS